MARTRFDQRYYQRFYSDPETRVSSPAERRRLGKFVASYLAHLDLPIRSVLDMGCGMGQWRAIVRREFRQADYLGVEISQAMCDTHGWERGSIVDWQCDQTFDLVICQGVLQYLDDAEAERALTNLCAWSATALYFEALTQRDWDENCDKRSTDQNVNLRTGSWYRRRLQGAFHNCGGGLFVKRTTPVVLFELEEHA